MAHTRVSYEYSHEGIKQSILCHARGMRLPEKWSEKIAERAAQGVDKWIEDKEVVTEEDLKQRICKELETLSPDIAFVYKNHGKII
ncbi:hypothetical protein IKF15_01860 [Candidatus Saccharibacteria bacterium]|nr:hypothetical protein [Candidatus Saccharibacteria bacterium]